jgi:hypothetical protein
MEIVTAACENLGVVYFVFCDGELAQISQMQQIPYNRKVCTVLGTLGLQGVADAVGARYLPLKSNGDVDAAIGQALSLAGERTPVIVGVDIDYSKRTRFTRGGGQGQSGPAVPWRKNTVHWPGVVAHSDRIDRTQKLQRRGPQMRIVQKIAGCAKRWRTG